MGATEQDYDHESIADEHKNEPSEKASSSEQPRMFGVVTSFWISLCLGMLAGRFVGQDIGGDTGALIGVVLGVVFAVVVWVTDRRRERRS